MTTRRCTQLAVALTCTSLLAAIVTKLPALPTPAAQPATKAKTPIKALLLTGGCCHDYATQKTVLSEGISKIANVEWTLVQEGGTAKDYINPRFNDPDWAKPYDIIIHDACFADVKDPDYIRKILKPHQNGKPAVVLHCAMHTFRDSPNADEYREFLGVTTHEHEPAAMLEIKPVKDQLQNPILTGFPELWNPPVRDEAYIILKEWPNTKALTTVYGKANNMNFTSAWISTYKNTRVFGTTMGHDTAVIKDPVYINLVARGLLWATNKLAPNGKPIPGYEP